MLTDLKYWLSNFLPYSVESWKGLLGHYNQTLWPYSLTIIPLTIVILWLVSRHSLQRMRLVMWLLAACWVWSGGVFLNMHFATLNWVARYFSWLFLLQAILLVVYSQTGGFKTAALSHKAAWWQTIPIAVALFALPLIQLLSGHQTHQIGWFAITPDTTALATIGLLGVFSYLPNGLIVIPVVWGIIVFANSWPLNDIAGMCFLPLLALILLFKRLSPR